MPPSMMATPATNRRAGLRRPAGVPTMANGAMKQPISSQDNRAIARPVFEGTLLWGRDEDGKPALVDDLTKAAAKIHQLGLFLLMNCSQVLSFFMV